MTAGKEFYSARAAFPAADLRICVIRSASRVELIKINGLHAVFTNKNMSLNNLRTFLMNVK